MLPTAGVPFLTHLLARIKAAGIEHVVLGTSFHAEVFEEYFGTGEELGLEIEYVVEESALGTGGGIPMSMTSCVVIPSWCLMAMCLVEPIYRGF